MFQPIAQFDTPALASLLISRLTEVGFHPAPLSESAHVQVAGVDRVYTVEVPTDERDSVLAFLEENGYGKHVVAG